LQARIAGRHDEAVAEELPLDRDDVLTTMGSLFDIRADIRHVIRLLEEDDGEEAQEEDDA
jgi:hypothetical protein